MINFIALKASVRKQCCDTQGGQAEIPPQLRISSLTAPSVNKEPPEETHVVSADSTATLSQDLTSPPPLPQPLSRKKSREGASLALSSSPLSSITSHEVNTYVLRTIFRGLGYNSVFLYHCTWFFWLSEEVSHSQIVAYFSAGGGSYSQTNFISSVTTWSAPPTHRK